jgi:hypothetical protein
MLDVELCMIVRDEATVIARALRSARPYVRAMHVVDTGSTDGTPTLAQAEGAQVSEMTWPHDFSAARNASLSRAQSPWILVLDADETLTVKDEKGLRERLSHPGLDALTLPCHNDLGDGRITIGPLCRIFRNRPDMRYEGQIHEQLGPIKAGRATVDDGSAFAFIAHDGHRPEAVQEKQKHLRNVALAERQVETRAHDPFAWFCLGQARENLLSSGAIDAAVRKKAQEAFAEAARLLPAPWPGEAYVVSLALSIVRLADRGAGATALDRAIEALPHSPDLRYARGVLRRQDGNIAGARTDFEACLTEAARHFFVKENELTAGAAARTQLAICLVHQGQLEAARTELEGARPYALAERLLATIGKGAS